MTYKLNDLVSYGGSIFRCKETHTAIGNFIDPFRFELEIPGQQYDNEWSNTIYYNQGDVVRYGGDIYQATQNNYDQQPSAQYEPLEFLKSGDVPRIIMITLLLIGFLYFIMASYVNQKYYLILGKIVCKRWFSWLLLLIMVSSAKLTSFELV